MIIQVAICDSQQHQSVVSSLCTCTTRSVSIPNENVGDQFDRSIGSSGASSLKHVEPHVLAVVWQYFALSTNSIPPSVSSTKSGGVGSVLRVQNLEVLLADW